MRIETGRVGTRVEMVVRGVDQMIVPPEGHAEPGMIGAYDDPHMAVEDASSFLADAIEAYNLRELQSRKQPAAMLMRYQALVQRDEDQRSIVAEVVDVPEGLNNKEFFLHVPIAAIERERELLPGEPSEEDTVVVLVAFREKGD